MSFACAVAEITSRIQQKKLWLPPALAKSKLLSHTARIIITQMTAQILVTRDIDIEGKYYFSQTSADEIALDVMTLLVLSCFPWMDILKDDIDKGIKARREFLLRMLESNQANNISTMSLAYVLVGLRKKPAARSIQLVLDENSDTSEAKNNQMTSKLAKFAQYFADGDFMNGESLVSIKASLLEGSFYTNLLHSLRTDIFPPSSSKRKDKYLEYIPPMFTFQSMYFERCIAPQWLFDIVLWSMFIFLVDEYMETHVANFSSQELQDMKNGIEKIHPEPDPRYSKIQVAQLVSDRAVDQEQIEPASSQRVETALSIFYKWAAWILNWDRLKKAITVDMNEFRSEIKKYILFHLCQAEDNSQLEVQQKQLETSPTYYQQRIKYIDNPRIGYATWLHTVGNGHISAPVSLAMAACYMGSWVRKGKDGWSSVMQRVLAYELNTHVAAYCRIYNDYGSINRDRDECNLNSINFPEFWTDLSTPEGSTGQRTDSQIWDKDIKVDNDTSKSTINSTLKSRLLEIGQHERVMADILAKKFYSSLERENTAEGKIIASAMRVYFRSGELFSDMYLSNDVTNTVK